VKQAFVVNVNYAQFRLWIQQVLSIE